MAKKDNKIMFKGYYDGHVVKGNQVIELKIKTPTDRIIDTINLLATLSRSLKIGAKFRDDVYNLGEFTIWSVKFDRDGEGQIILRSDTEYANMEGLNNVADNEILFTFAAVIMN